MEVFISPFLKRKDSASTGLIVKDRSTDEKPQEDQDDREAALLACMHELIEAIHAKDIYRAAQAFKDAQECSDIDSDSQEAPSPHSYQAQNIKAGDQT